MRIASLVTRVRRGFNAASKQRVAVVGVAVVFVAVAFGATYSYLSKPVLELVGEGTQVAATSQPVFKLARVAKAEAKEVKLVKGGQTLSVEPVLTENSDGSLNITVPPVRNFRPGKYLLSVSFDRGRGVETITQDFTWGVLAFNVYQQPHRVGDDVAMGLAVLDDAGITLCDATVALEVKQPNGEVVTPTINRSDICADKYVTDIPDYTASLKADQAGTYEVQLTAQTADGERSLRDSFQVVVNPGATIKRETSMRIYPKSEYKVALTIVSDQVGKQTIKELVPNVFGISGLGKKGVLTQLDGQVQEIAWEVELEAGKPTTVTYSYDAPDISPEFYLLGPASVGAFKESRAWQIASDEVGSASSNRIWSSGAELNSLTADMEITSSSGTTPTVDGTTKRSGDYAFRTNTSSNTATIYKTWANSAQTAKYWFRTYVRVDTTPGVEMAFMRIGTTTNNKIGVRMNTDRTIELWNEEDSTQIGSASSALTASTWYRVEVFVDTTTISSTDATLKLDGVTVASSTAENLAAGVDRLTWGNLTSTTANMYFDDIAINGDITKADNWPGEGKIVHMHGNADGDNEAWTASPSDTDDYDDVNEVTPSDSTGGGIGTATSSAITEINLESASSAGITSGDTIKLVSVGARIEPCVFAPSGWTGGGPPPSCTAGDGDINYKTRIRATSGGTVEDSGNIGIDDQVSFVTNDDDTSKLSKLTLYDLPGATTYTPWTTTSLDTTQIGVSNHDTTDGFKATAFWLLVEYTPLSGGRLYSSGFELNSTADDMEFSSTPWGLPSISTTTVRSGSYSLRSDTSFGAEIARYNFATTNSSGHFYLRTYLQIATLPDVDTRIMSFNESASSARRIFITMTTTGTLELRDEDGQIGSASSALSTGTWYRIELKADLTPAGGSQVIDGRIDGTSFASSSTRNISTGLVSFDLGFEAGCSGVCASSLIDGDIFFDDVALNEAVGATQNSWPGNGAIIHLSPNAAGDNSAWTNSYTNIDDTTPPNDATDIVSETTTNDILDVNLTDSSLGSETITLVSAGVRFRSNTATEEDFKVRLKDAASGNTIESNTLTPASTTFKTNATSAPNTYPITAYTRPEQSTVWTDTQLDAAQIGFRDTAGSGTAEVSSAWLLVEYQPIVLITVSGTIYSDEGVTVYNCSADNLTIGVSVNGGATNAGTCTSAGGTYSITVSANPSAAGESIAVWIDSTETPDATMVTRAADTTSNITGADLYQNRLIVKHEDSGPITNANLATADNANAGIKYGVSSGNLTVESGISLLVATSKTFTPGGTVTTNTTGGDFKIGTSATFSPGSNAVSVGGSWTNSGTFTAGTSTVTFTATTTGKTLSGTLTNPSAFYNLTFNGAGGEWTNSSSLLVNDFLTLTAGTFAGTNTVYVNGSVIGTAGIINRTGGLFEQRVQLDKNFGTSSGSSTWTFSDLNFTNAHANTGRTITTQTGGSGTIRVTGVMKIGISGDAAGATTTLDAGNRNWELAGTGGDPFQILASPAGVLTGATSTFTYVGSNAGGSTTIQTAAYCNLSIGDTGADTYVLEGATSTATSASCGDFSINSPVTSTTTVDVVSGSNHSLTIGGNATLSSSTVLNAQAGTVTFNATDAGNTINGAFSSTSSFYNLTFNGVGGAWSFTTATIAVTNNLTITNGTVTAPATSLTIGSSYSNAGTFTHNSGTVTFNSIASGKTLAGTMTSTSSFYNLTFDGVAGAWAFSNAVAVANDFNVTNGAVTASSNNLTVSRDVTLANTSGVAYTPGTSTLSFTRHFNDTGDKFVEGTTSIVTHTGTGTITVASTSRFETMNVGASGFTTTLSNNAIIIEVSLTLNGGTVTGGGSYFELRCASTCTPLIFNSPTTLNGTATMFFRGGAASSAITMAGGDYGNWTIIGYSAAGNNTSFVLGGNIITTAELRFEATTALTGTTFSTTGSNYSITASALQIAPCGNSRLGTITASLNDSVVTLTNTTNSLYVGSNCGSHTLNLNTSDVTVSGSVSFVNGTASLTVNPGTSDFRFAPPNSTTKTFTPNGQSLYNTFIQALGSAGTVLLAGAMDVNNNLTITTGLLDVDTTSNYAVTIGGSYSNSGTFESRTGTVTFDATTTGKTLSGTMTYGNGDFVNLTFNGVGGEWTLSNDVDIASALTVTNGTLLGAVNVDISGDFTGAGTVTMSGGTLTHRGGGPRSFGTTSGSNNWSFNNLSFGNSSGSIGITFTTQTGGSGTVTVAGVLLVGISGNTQVTTLDAGNRTWILSGTTGDPFQLLVSPAAVLTASTSTYRYTGNYGSGDSTIQSATYYNLETSNGSETYVLEAATTASNNLTNTAGTLDVTASNFGLTIGNNYSNSGTFNSRAGTVTFTATASGKTLSGTLNNSSAFYGLTFNGVSGAWSHSTGMEVARDLTITNGTLTSGASLSVFRDLIITDNANVYYIPGSNTVTVLRDFTDTNGSRFTYGTSTLRMTQTGTLTTNSTYNLSVAFTGYTTTFSSSLVTAVYGTLTVNGGTLTSASGYTNLLCSVNCTPMVFAAPSTLTGTRVVSYRVNGGTNVVVGMAGGNYGSWQVGTYVSGTNNATYNFLGNVTTTTDLVYSIADGVTGTTFNTSNYDIRAARYMVGDGAVGRGGAGTHNLGSSVITLTSNSSALYPSSANNTTSHVLNLQTSRITLSGGLLFVNGTGGMTVNPGTSTVTFAPAAPDTIGYYPNGQSLYNLVVDGAGTFRLEGAVYVDNDLTIRAGTLDTKSGSNFGITVGGNWSNTGTFTARSGVVTFNDAAKTSTFAGATSFYSLTSTTPLKALRFTSGTTFTITGVLTLTGSVGNPINVASTTSGSQWDIYHQGTESVTYTTVTDSGCHVSSTAITLDSTNTNGGNNDSCWEFAFVISGTVYDTDGVTVVATGPTVRLKLNGAGSYTAVANGSGVYSISNVPAVANDVVVVYLDTGGGIKGETYTRVPASSQTLNIYRDRSTLRCDNGTECQLTPGNIGLWDRDDDSDINTGLTLGNLQVQASSTLSIRGGFLADGGAMDGFNVNGDMEIVSGGTFANNNAIIWLYGSYVNSGTYTTSSEQLRFAATTTGKTISGTLTGTTGKMNNVEFNGSGGGWTYGTAAEVKDLLITLGTVVAPSSSLTITNSMERTGGTFTHNSGKVIFTAASSTGYTLGTFTGSNAFYKGEFGASGELQSDKEWALDGDIEFSAANATDTMVLKGGVVWVGQGGGNTTLTSAGGVQIATSSGETATLRLEGENQGVGSHTFDLNANTSTPSCANCIMTIGATSGSGEGLLSLGENNIVRLNPRSSATASDTGIIVQSTGRLYMSGSLYSNNLTSTALDTVALRETKVCANSVLSSYNTGSTLRMSSGLAIGRTYAVTATSTDDANCGTNTHDSLTRASTTSATETTPTVSGSGSTRTLTLTTQSSIIAADGDEVGRYVHNLVDDTYFRIISSDQVGAGTDTLTIVAEPDSLSGMATNEDIEITDGVRPGDTFDVIDYASITAEAGETCNATVDGAGEAYISAAAGAEVSITNGKICNMGRNSTGKNGVTFTGINGANSGEGVTIQRSAFLNNYTPITFDTVSNNAGSKGVFNSYFSGNSNFMYLVAGSGVELNGNFIDQTSSLYIDATNNVVLTGNTLINTSNMFIGSSYGSSATSNIFACTSPVASGLTLQEYYGGTFTSNTLMGCGTALIVDTYSSGNRITSNTLYGNDAAIMLNAGSNVLTSNTIYGNTTGIGSYSYGVANTYRSNVIQGNSTAGIVIDGDYSPIFAGNSIYGNGVGVSLERTTYDAPSNLISLGDTFGSPTVNTTSDISFGTTSESSIEGFASTFASTTPFTGIGTATSNSAVIYNRDGVAGVNQIYGEHILPLNDVSTMYDESVLNIRDDLPVWPDRTFTSTSEAGLASGAMGTIYTGNTAAMGGSSTSYTYQAICIQTNCSTTPASWNVYRNGTLLTAAASSEVQYTDTQTDGGSAPNVTFTIPKSSSGSYGQGYNLTFTSRKSATDSGEDKIYKVMTDGATIYVNANTTLNVHGISEAGSFLEPNTTTTTYNLVNNGTINLDLGTLNVSGSLTGSGILEGTVDGSVLMAAGSSTAKTFGTTSGSNTWKVGTLGFRNRSASAVTYTLSAGGTGDLVVLGYTSIGNELDPQTTTVTNATNNRVLRLTSVNIGADGGFTASATALLSIEAEWNFATGGVFTPSGGTVTFTGANPSTLSGTTTFANLTISSPISKTMNFSTSGIVHVTGVFSAQGLIGQPHLLQSTSGGTKWHFHPTGTYSIDNIQVKDGGCETGALSMTVSNSTNLGNNESCWVFNDTTGEANRLNSGTIRGGSGTIRIK